MHSARSALLSRAELLAALSSAARLRPLPRIRTDMAPDITGLALPMWAALVAVSGSGNGSGMGSPGGFAAFGFAAEPVALHQTGAGHLLTTCSDIGLKRSFQANVFCAFTMTGN
jgi:hypothetical protein